MAIQNRKGNYSDFRPEKMVSGELAVVLSGDPNADSGRSVYVCFQPGVVKRLTTYQDFEDELQKESQEIRDQFTADIRSAINNSITATNAANEAQKAANAAAEAANKAATAANQYVLGDISDKTVVFAESSSNDDIVSGEKISILFGKILKRFHSIGNSLTELNTKSDNSAITLTDTWYFGFLLSGGGFQIPIVTNCKNAQISKTEVFVDGVWKVITFNGAPHIGGCLVLQCSDPDGAKNGTAYLCRLNGQIS